MSEPSILIMYEIYGGVSHIVYQLITTPFYEESNFWTGTIYITANYRTNYLVRSQPPLQTNASSILKLFISLTAGVNTLEIVNSNLFWLMKNYLHWMNGQFGEGMNGYMNNIPFISVSGELVHCYFNPNCKTAFPSHKKNPWVPKTWLKKKSLFESSEEWMVYSWDIFFLDFSMQVSYNSGFTF